MRRRALDGVREPLKGRGQGATIQAMQRREDAKPTGGDPLADPEGAPESWDPHDDALITWMLSLTPAQRLEALQGWVDSIQALRDGARP